jgi:intracellular sulfur oxidation DsrE/DsrF family protein
VLLVALLSGTVYTAADEPSWQTPAIVGYGRIVHLNTAVLQPERTKTYKVVFDVTEAAGKPSAVNPQLDHVARAVNLFVAAGVTLDQLYIAAVIHGPATPISLRDEAYQKKFGHPNPNAKLLMDLRKAGVKIYLCGQAAAASGIETDDMLPTVTPTLSAITALVILQDDGYRLVTD